MKPRDIFLSGLHTRVLWGPSGTLPLLFFGGWYFSSDHPGFHGMSSLPSRPLHSGQPGTVYNCTRLHLHPVKMPLIDIRNPSGRGMSWNSRLTQPASSRFFTIKRA